MSGTLTRSVTLDSPEGEPMSAALDTVRTSLLYCNVSYRVSIFLSSVPSFPSLQVRRVGAEAQGIQQPHSPLQHFVQVLHPERRILKPLVIIYPNTTLHHPSSPRTNPTLSS